MAMTNTDANSNANINANIGASVNTLFCNELVNK